MSAGYPPNFKPNEFYCKCGKCLGAPPNAYATRHLAWALQKIRNAAGVPLKINSAYRCQEHNESVGGAKNSQHLSGIAADLKPLGCSTEELHEVIESLVDSKHIPPGGLGLYNTFVHYDIRPGKARWNG
tara:strand:+ start:4965 stop:5351 length:387 start_codon:yes stop_codon:yes gene_type:complete